MGKGRGLGQPAPDEGGEILDDPGEELGAFRRAGLRRGAGDAVAAGAVDRVGEDEALGAVRVVGIDDAVLAHEAGASACISAVSARLACQSSASRKWAARTRPLTVAVLISATIRSSCRARSNSRAQRRGAALVTWGVDEEQAAHAGVIGLFPDLPDESVISSGSRAIVPGQRREWPSEQP
jgi:hypothetical protein